jgi:regulator of cell morphogenesis and NO signaling
MSIDPSRRVADLAIERPSRIPAFEALGLDYCCGGKRPLADACRAAGLEVDQVTAALARADAEADEATRSDDTDWTRRPLDELLDHIVSRHHDYLRRELPRLSDLASRVREAHAAKHPELERVEEQLGSLRFELESHLQKEEQVLFPLIRAMEEGDDASPAHCGSVANPIAVMESEHDEAGEALRNLRSWTGGYTPPADACPTYHAFLAGLAALESDLHVHIHKENNILHPRAMALESSRPGGVR